MRFIHHPDNYIVIGSSVYPMDFWMLAEPDYAGPVAPYNQRIFDPGRKHVLVHAGRPLEEAQDLNWGEGLAYISKKSVYDAALTAFEQGAKVGNSEGVVTALGPPSLTANVSEIENNGTDQAVITCDVDNPNYTGDIVWDIIYPDGFSGQEVEAAVGGVSQLALTTLQEGAHGISASSVEYGTQGITVWGI